MASRARRNQPGSRPDFPWYSFPRNVGSEIYTRWNAKLDWLKQRKVHVPALVDWYWMSETGLMEAIEPYLEKVFNGIHGQFMCLGWRRLSKFKRSSTKNWLLSF
ncbi:unnamed protein product [Lactuca virosa]|uniref:Uncharacterized protein n=1 Tax=Lactuca virosa TaxID=75947 RepID=A0AAU9MDI3_9ASTR|nr:unnamed protein product [Lactuca virosa]